VSRYCRLLAGNLIFTRGSSIRPVRTCFTLPWKRRATDTQENPFKAQKSAMVLWLSSKSIQMWS